jgi:hypothetical protein
MRVSAIENALTPIVTRICAATQRGFAFLLGRFPPSGMLADLAEREAATFEAFMKARDAGLPLPYRDTPKAGTFKMVEREHAIQSVKIGAIYVDAIAQAQARLSGHILSGRVRLISTRQIGRKTVHRFVVETAQNNLRMRQRDELAWLTDARLRCIIESIDRRDAVTRVQLRMSAGMRCIGPPRQDTEIELAPPPPDWGALGRQRQKFAARLATAPWTHSRDAVLPPDAVNGAIPPTDLLIAIEAFR